MAFFLDCEITGPQSCRVKKLEVNCPVFSFTADSIAHRSVNW